MNNRVVQILFFLTATSIISINFSIAVSSITMGAAIILLLGSLLVTRFSTYKQTPLDYFLLFYAVAELLATIFSVDSSSSLFNMKRLFLISVFYLIAISVDEESKLKWLFMMLLLVASLLSVFEIFSVTKIGGKIMRVSLFQYFLTEGGIKMIMLLMLIPFVVHPATPRLWRWFSAITIVPLFVGLILTQTRSSWLGFIVGVITIGLMKSKKLILALILLVVLVLAFAPSDFRSRAASIFDPNMKSNLTRIHMVTTGWQMFLDKPVFGWGDIDLRKYYITYITPIDEAEGGHLHNNFMMLLVTIGTVGIVATITMFVKIFFFEVEVVKATSGHWLYGSIALGSFASYLGFHVNGLFEWNFGDHEIAVLLWLTVGLTLAVNNLHNKSNKQ